jgi:uncharacterized Zn-binding protein involved in type VI secretion
MSAVAAARLGDEIAHGMGVAAMIGGALVGAIVGAAIVAAAAVAAPLTIAIIIGGSIAIGALSMKQLVKGVSKVFNLSEPVCGTCKIGSTNVFVNGRAAARAGVDLATPCSGSPMNHPSLLADVLIAEGSSTVHVNGFPFARLKDKLTCGGHLSSGSPNVFIGGEPQGTGHTVWDLEGWMETGFEILAGAALVGAGGLAAAAGIGALAVFGAVVVGSSAAMSGLGYLGDRLGPGYADLLQGAAGLGLLFAGPRLARAPKAKAPQSSSANAAAEKVVAGESAAGSAAARQDLYRGDGRSPDVIFNEGFQPRGTNTDVYRYAKHNEPSIYIPTSVSQEVGAEFAQMQGGGYVYTIRGQPGINVNEVLGKQSPFPWEAEIAVPGPIKPQDIKGAVQVTPDGKLVGPFIENPGYVQ